MFPRKSFVLGDGGAALAKCVLSRAAVQSIANSSTTVVIWDVPTVIDSTFSYNAGTGVVTVPAGTYLITFISIWAANVTGQRLNNIRTIDITGSVALVGALTSTTVQTNGNFVTCGSRIMATGGGTIDFLAFQNSGGALNLGGSSVLHAEIIRLGD